MSEHSIISVAKGPMQREATGTGSRQGPSCWPEPSESPGPIGRNGWHAGCCGPGRGRITAAHAKHAHVSEAQCHCGLHKPEHLCRFTSYCLRGDLFVYQVKCRGMRVKVGNIGIFPLGL